MKKIYFPGLLFLLASIYSSSPGQGITRQEAVQKALQNNLSIKSAEFQVEYFKQLKKTGTDIGKMSAVWMHGQYNSIYQDNNLTLTQTLPFPTTLGASVRLGKAQVAGSLKNLTATQNELVFEVKSAYELLLYREALRKLLISQDSLYHDFARASGLRYKTGESNLLEKTTAETQSLEVKNLLNLNEADIRISQTRLQTLLNSDEPITVRDRLVKITSPDEGATIQNNPQLDYLKQEVVISGQQKKLERNKFMPDLILGYFNQSLTGVQNIDGQDTFFSSDKHFSGFQVGLGIPLWFAPFIAKSKAAAYKEEATRKNAEYFEATLAGAYAQAIGELDKNSASLNYYETSALSNADLLLSQAVKSYKGGEIGYLEYLQSLKNALAIRSNYLLALTQYNQAVIKLEFLSGKF